MADDTTGPALRSHDWAVRTGGALTAAERRRTRIGIARGYVDVTKGLARWIVRRAPGAVDLPTAPDSRFARLAEEAAAEQSPAIEGHGYRTWILGGALAVRDRVAVDPEVFYVASLLHDAGMTQEVLGEDFTIRSGQRILEVCGSRRAADAAVAHATPGLSVEDEPNGFYVQAGAMADLVGIRAWDLPHGHLRQAYAAHPAADVHRVIAGHARREALAVPEGRFAQLRRSGFTRMVQMSPLRRL